MAGSQVSREMPGRRSANRQLGQTVRQIRRHEDRWTDRHEQRLAARQTGKWTARRAKCTDSQ